jgi:type IV pilus assembly protein PilM
MMAGSQVAWGLDIGATALKAVKLRRDGDKVAIEAFDVVEHDKFLSEPDVDRDAIIRTSLQKFIDRNNPKRDTLLISVAGSKTFARFVKLPPVEPKKIPEIVKFEAIQQIPFPLEQVNWDYQTFATPDSPEVEVGIFAMKTDLVAQELGCFTAQNMTVHGVQLAPLALYNAASFDDWTGGKGTLLIDIGAEHTDLVIVDAGRIWLRTINLGGNHFTEALAKAFKQPFSRAEQLKKSAATSKYQKQIFQAMRPIFADLVAEVSRSLGHYQASHRESKLERIVAMGNPFKLPNLQKYIQQELKMEVVRLESFQNGRVDTKLAAGLQENILSLGVAYGLALQGLDHAAIDTNLLPVNIARQMIWKRKRPWFAGATAAMLAGCATWWTFDYMEVREFDRVEAEENVAVGANHGVAYNEAQRGKFAADKKSFDSTNSNYTTSKAEVERLMRLAESRSLIPMVFDDIYQALPQRGLVYAPGTYPVDRTGTVQYIAIRSLNPWYKARLGDPIPKYTDDGEAGTGSGAGAGAGAGAGVPTGALTEADVKDRGFVIDVDVYTPSSPGGTSGPAAGSDRVCDNFREAIRKAAPPTSSKKYYLTTTLYQRIFNEPGTSFDKVDWGWGYTASKTASVGGGGSFWPVFVPRAMGLPQNNAPVGPFGRTVESTVGLFPTKTIDAYLARPGVPPGRASMDGYTRFLFKVKVHLK